MCTHSTLDDSSGQTHSLNLARADGSCSTTASSPVVITPMTTATFRDIVDDLSICIQTDGNDSGRNALLPTCLPVPRIPQQENWDCGIACLQMVLHFVNGGDGADAVHSREAIMRRVGPSVKSVWTIDLAIALASFLSEIRRSSAGGTT